VSTVERLLARLEQVRKSGASWTARCPAHQDRNPSLSIKVADDGRVLVKCHAGCTFEEIVRAVELEPSDLLPDDHHAEWTPRGPAVAVYTYVDEEGQPLFEVCRTADKQFPQRRPDPGSRSGWRWNLDGVRRVIYRLPEVLKAVAASETIFVVEGEKDVATIEAAGGVATCNPGGAGKWRADYAQVFVGARVVIVADRDEAGSKHADQVAKSLIAVAASVRCVEAAVGKDAADHIAAGCKLDDFQPLGELARREPIDLTDLTVDQILAANPALSKDELLAGNPLLKAMLAGKETVATEIARLICDSGALLFRDRDGIAYLSFEDAGRRETWPLRSRRAKLYARELYHRAREKAPNGQAVNDALATLEAKAVFDGPELDVHLRLAGDGRTTHIDLGDAAWRAVTITPSGWTIVGEHPVRFVRSRGIAALPDPVTGGSLKMLREFVNVGSDDDWRLLVGWLLAAWRPPGQPYPVLGLNGEQGSGKSTTARVLRELVDPSTVSLRAAPHDVRDLMISASSSWLVSLDNLSHLQPWLSDALCRLATGGGFATRELYTDADEILFEAQRPVIINGIEELATRSDLLDRSILLSLPTIPSGQRRTEEQYWADFYKARPAILGGLLDALVGALARIDSVQLETLPRMADFARWTVAAEPALGWEPGSFMAAYGGNRAQAHELAVEASVVGPALLELAGEGFEGTSSDLLAELTERVDEKAIKSREWPKNGRAMSGVMKRLAPNLRALGYEIEQYREATAQRRRLWRIRRDES